MKWLLVGLGNPGNEYADTRHNAGFWWIDRVSGIYLGQWKLESKFQAYVAKVNIGAHQVWFLKPVTYMNRSGSSVRAIMDYYDIDLEHLLIAHDELDLPVGSVKLKQDGGHGGHNGLRDIIAHTNSKNFKRLRLGIGHPGNAKQVVDYVLKTPGKNERQQIDTAIETSLQSLKQILDDQWQEAVRQLHTSAP